VAATAGPAGARRGSLVVVGTGITGIGQVTLEAAAAIERAERLFYLVVDPVTEAWIRERNPAATSLADLYEERKPRRRTYMEMADRLVTSVKSGMKVCAAFYGHPGVLVEPSHAAIRRLRRQGYAARMLPGVSADACLVADLGMNPGDRGLQSFEATEFLLSRRRFDPTSELILWQVGVLGDVGSRQGAAVARPDRLLTLTKVLRRHYPPDHRVILYYAPTFPTNPPRIQRLSLDKLPKAKVSPLALLYVPALPAGRPFDRRIVRWYRRADDEETDHQQR
jgi:hypothetical protein